MENNKSIFTDRKYIIPFAVGIATIICLACLIVLHAMNNDGKDNCNTAYGHLSDGETVWIKAVIFISALLSVCGTSFIIFSYYYFIPLRTFPIKMIVMLSFTDLFSSLSYFVGFANHAALCFEREFSCTLSAIMTQFFDVASFCWMTIIAFNIYQIISKERGSNVEDNEKYYHLFAWGLPSLLLIIVVSTDSMGDAGNWCWIKKEYVFERLFCYYIPLILLICSMAYIYSLIAKSLKNFEMHATKNAITRRLQLYLTVFLITRIPSIINRFVELASGESIFIFVLLHSIFSPLQGFLNALIYGMNKKIINQWKDFLSTRCTCCKKTSDNNNTNVANGTPSSSIDNNVGDDEKFDNIENVSTT